MPKLRGRGLSGGVAMGTAAVVRMRNGLPVPPSVPPRVLAQLTRRREDETPDVILVAEDYSIAEAFSESVRWGKVVGIVAIQALEDVATPAMPAVAGVAGLLETVKDDMLLIVDADRGLVIADPDGIMVAHYQAERNRLAPKRRLYLGTAHLPARTLDGREIQIFARVTNADDIATAIDAGADALFLPPDNELLPNSSDDEDLDAGPERETEHRPGSISAIEQVLALMEPEHRTDSLAALEQVQALSSDFSTPNQQPTPSDQRPNAPTPSDQRPNAPTPNAQRPTPPQPATSNQQPATAFSTLLQQAANKPLLIANGYQLPAGDLLQAAARAEITVACPLMPHLEGQGIGELGQELNEVRADFLANDTLCEMPRLAVELPASYPLPLPSDDPEESAFFMDRLAYNGATRLFIGLDNDLIDPPLIGWLNEVVASANTAMLPVLVHWIVWFFQFGGGEDDNEESLSEDALITLQWLIGSGIAGIVVTPDDVKKVKQAIRRLGYSECREAVTHFLSGDQES